MKVFERRALRRILNRRRMEWQETDENYITRSFMICTLRKAFLQVELLSSGG
jgi:hypothetical protein